MVTCCKAIILRIKNLQPPVKFGYGLKEEVLVYVMTEILFLEVLRTDVFIRRLSKA